MRSLGLTGVALGTLISAFYNVVWQGRYAYAVVYGSKAKLFPIVQDLIKNIWILFMGYWFTKQISIHAESYYQWIGLGIIHFLVWFFAAILANLIVDRSELKELCRKIFRRYTK